MDNIKLPCSIGQIVDYINGLKRKEAEVTQALIGLRDRDFEKDIEKDERYSVKILWEELQSIRGQLSRTLCIDVNWYKGRTANG